MWAESIKLSTYICIIYGRIEFLFHQPWGESCLPGGDVFGTPTGRVMFWASVLSWRTDRNAVEAQWSMDSSTEKKLLDSLADTSTGRFFWNTPSSTPRRSSQPSTCLVETTKQKHIETQSNTYKHQFSKTLPTLYRSTCRDDLSSKITTGSVQ